MEKFTVKYQENINEGFLDRFNIFKKKDNDKKDNDSEKKKSGISLIFTSLFGGILGGSTELQKHRAELKAKKREEIDKMKSALNAQKLKLKKQELNTKQATELQQLRLRNQEKIDNCKAAEESLKRQALYFGKTDIKFTSDELAAIISSQSKEASNANGTNDEDLDDKFSRLLQASLYDESTDSFRDQETIEKMLSDDNCDNEYIKQLKNLYKDNKDELINKVRKEKNLMDACSDAINTVSILKTSQTTVDEHKDEIKKIESQLSQLNEYNAKIKELNGKIDESNDAEEKKKTMLNDGWNGIPITEKDDVSAENISKEQKINILNNIKKEIDEAGVDFSNLTSSEKKEKYNEFRQNICAKYGLQEVMTDDALESLRMGDKDITSDSVGNFDINLDKVGEAIADKANKYKTEVIEKANNLAKYKEDKKSVEETYKDVKDLKTEDLEAAKTTLSENIKKHESEIRKHEDQTESLKEMCKEAQSKTADLEKDKDDELQNEVRKMPDDLSAGETFNENGKRGYYDENGEFHERPKVNDNNEDDVKKLEKYLGAAKSTFIKQDPLDMCNVKSIKKDGDTYVVELEPGGTKTGLSAAEAAKYEYVRKKAKTTWKTESEKIKKKMIDDIVACNDETDMEKLAKDSPEYKELLDAIKNDDEGVLGEYEKAFKNYKGTNGEYGKKFSLIKHLKDNDFDDNLSDINIDDEDTDDSKDDEERFNEIADKIDKLEKKKENDELSDEEKDELKRLKDEADEIFKNNEKNRDDGDDGENDGENDGEEKDDTGKPKRFIKKQKGKRKGSYRYVVYDANGKPKKDKNGKPELASKDDWRSNMRAWRRYKKKTNNTQNESYISLKSYILNNMNKF